MISSFVWPTLGRLCVLLSAVASLGSAFADCPSERSWLPTTPAPTFDRPAPHPAPDCGFYAPAWQNFLYVTKPDAGGNLRFSSYSTISDVFGPAVALRFARQRTGLLSLAPRALKGSNDPASDPPGKAAVVNAGARQAGLNGLLVDQRGNPVLYAIHMNPVFVDFVRQKGLTTKAALQGASPDTSLPTGAVELKSAWQIVPASSTSDNFITTPALVPVLKQVGDTITVDDSAARSA
jgi:hypothetical protein